MSFSKNRRSLFPFFALTLLAACSSSKGTGAARQACYANGTCNTGLICLSSVCVAPPDGGAGTTGTAGAGGASGNAGAGGAAAGTSGGDAAAGTSGGDAAAGTSGDAAAGTSGDAAAGRSGGDAAAGTSGTDASGDAVVNCGLPSSWGTLSPASNIQFGDEFTPMLGSAKVDETDWQGYLPDPRIASDNDILDVSLYSTIMPFGSTITAMPSIDLSLQSNVATCGACVIMVVDADTNLGATVPFLQLGSTYVATQGTLAVTAVPSFPAVAGSRISGTLANVEFEHVNIDPQTNATTPVGDGCKFMVTSVAFDTTVMNMNN